MRQGDPPLCLTLTDNPLSFTGKGFVILKGWGNTRIFSNYICKKISIQNMK